MSESIEQKVKEIIVEQLGVGEDAVTPEASIMDDLGADSLDLVELVMSLEQEFLGDEQIPEDEQEKLSTVGDVINYIKGQKS